MKNRKLSLFAAALSCTVALYTPGIPVYAEASEIDRNETEAVNEEFVTGAVSSDTENILLTETDETAHEEADPDTTGEEDNRSAAIRNTDEPADDHNSDSIKEPAVDHNSGSMEEPEENESPGSEQEEQQENRLTVSDSGSSRTISAQLTEKVSGLKAAVWSAESGQDDLRWYTLKEQEDGSWSGTIEGSNLYHPGKCYAHFYTDKNVFVGDVIFTMKEDEVIQNPVTVTGEGSERTVSAVLPDGASGIKAAVWSAQGGQDDLKWYTLKKGADNTWSAAIDLGSLKHSGSCFVHCYTTSNQFVGAVNFKISEADRTVNRVSVSDSGSDRQAAAFTSNSVSGVRVAVWSAQGGQDDIKWYTLKKQSDGRWLTTVSGSSLKHAGTCNAHFYDNKNQFIGAATFIMEQKDIAAASVAVTGSGKSRTITVRPAGSVPGLKAAVWSSTGGQDDLRWYTLKKGADNTWSAAIDLGSLKHSGSCFMHCYTTANQFVGAVTFKISDSDKPVTRVSVSDSGLTRQATAVTSGSVSGVRVAVWSDQNGQDDIRWYTLKKQGGGSWSTVIDGSRLKHTGICNAHFYDSQNHFLGAATFTMKAITGSSIDYIQWAVNIANNDAIGYGHTWPKTISCAGLVGLALTKCGYGDFVKNDPLGWGYIDLGPEYEQELIKVVDCSVLPGPWTSARVGELLPGDILYYYRNETQNHVGFYMGNGRTVEARGPGGSEDRDSNGREVAVYDCVNSPINFHKVFRIPAEKIHYINP